VQVPDFLEKGMSHGAMVTGVAAEYKDVRRECDLA
jgi:hypothetical protein